MASTLLRSGEKGLSLCTYNPLIETQLYKLPFGAFFEDVTILVYGGANKASASQQTAGFLQGEDVGRATLIVSNDIPAEVINRT